MMLKVLLKRLAIIVLIMGLSGCSATKDVKLRNYVQDKKRVDQDLGGALGNWESSPEVRDDEDRKETRRVYVLEVSKEALTDVNVTEIEIEETMRSSSPEKLQNRVQKKKITRTTMPKLNIPSFDDDYDVTDENEVSHKFSKFIDYTVEKNDTLQKISKKFYDSYAKWHKIYDVNKTAIKNPDNIKPGIVIKIPVE